MEGIGIIGTCPTVSVSRYCCSDTAREGREQAPQLPMQTARRGSEASRYEIAASSSARGWFPKVLQGRYFRATATEAAMLRPVKVNVHVS